VFNVSVKCHAVKANSNSLAINSCYDGLKLNSIEVKSCSGEITMKNLKYGVIMSCFLMASCTSTEPEEQLVSIENDPRIGEKVQQACFINSINSWSNVDNDNKALLIHMNRKQKYKLNLTGTCDADWAIYRIAIIGKSGSTCLQRGDKLRTDANTMRGMSCTIMSINKWHPEKLEEMKKADEQVEPSNESI